MKILYGSKMRKKKNKAVALLSGGLDSRLAIKVVQQQGTEVIALNFVHCFYTGTPKGEYKSEARKASEEFGIPLKIIDITKEFIELVRNPKHGYGKNMNPCIDCRIHMCSTAKKYMQKIGASFLISGEILGQRPMSQRRDAMRIIDKESGAEGLILRPLSAKNLPPTIPEKMGWVDRKKLLGIKGRSRKEQIRLAKKYSITDYPDAAGGCLLTYEGFARKVKDLLQHKDADVNDFLLLKVGRHFRLPEKGKVVVGRNEKENPKMLTLARENDIVFTRNDGVGPTVILRDSNSENEKILAATLVASHSRLDGALYANVVYYPYGKPVPLRTVQVAPLKRTRIDELRI